MEVACIRVPGRTIQGRLSRGDYPGGLSRGDYPGGLSRGDYPGGTIQGGTIQGRGDYPGGGGAIQGNLQYINTNHYSFLRWSTTWLQCGKSFWMWNPRELWLSIWDDWWCCSDHILSESHSTLARWYYLRTTASLPRPSRILWGSERSLSTVHSWAYVSRQTLQFVRQIKPQTFVWVFFATASVISCFIIVRITSIFSLCSSWI